jgi:hypothetical protein
MNRVRWAAWGVVDIEKLERMQRRNYIKAVRAELAEKNITLECGGSTQTPYYQIILPAPNGQLGVRYDQTIPKQAVAGENAFKKVCAWLLLQLGEDNHERSEDGSVRSA